MEASLAGGTMPSFWQVGAALLTVLALLVLALKGLGRLQRNQDGAGARLLQVRRLGPRRELEVLKVDGEVFTIYRRDSGLAVLKQESHEGYRARQAAAPAGKPGTSLGRRLLALAAAAGGATASRPPNP